MNILTKPNFLQYVKEKCEKKLKEKVKFNKNKQINNIQLDTTEKDIELEDIQTSDIKESSKLTAEEFAKAVGINIYNRECGRVNCSCNGYGNAVTINYADINNNRKSYSSVFDESFFKNPSLSKEETKNVISKRKRSASTSVVSSCNNNSKNLCENNVYSRCKRSVSSGSVSTCVNSNYNDSEIEYPDNDSEIVFTQDQNKLRYSSSFNSSSLSSSSQNTIKNSIQDNQIIYYNTFSHGINQYGKAERSLMQNEATLSSRPVSFNSSILIKPRSRLKVTKSVTFYEGTRFSEIDIHPMIPDEVKVYTKGRFTITQEISRRSSIQTC